MHDGVGDGGDIVPAKRRAVEGEGVGEIVGVADGEDKFGFEGWGEDEGPVEVGDVGLVEEDGEAGAEEGFERREVREREFGRVERLGEVGRFCVEDGAEFR